MLSTIERVKVKELRPLKLQHENIKTLSWKCPRGIFGMYYRLTQRTGLKFIRNNEYVSWKVSSHTCRKKLKNRWSWMLARQEAQLMAEAYQKTEGKYVPYCYGYLAVQVGKRWYSAIKVQHVVGVTCEMMERSWEDREAFCDHCQKRLREYGVLQRDINVENVIVNMRGNKVVSWKVVDFSPQLSSPPS